MVKNRQSKNQQTPDTGTVPLIKGHRATSYDVARLAGVSQSAVSRCFKQGASVSEKMRSRVMKAAAELEYQPNAIARGLITQRSNLVALLVPSRQSLYYPEVLFRLTEELSKAGLRALLFTVESESEAEAVIEQAWQFQVDGLISASHLSREQFDILEKRNIPIVFFNRYFSDRPTNTVYCDPVLQIEELIRQLAEFGHHRFGIVAGPEDNMVSQERVRKISEALETQNLPAAIRASGDFSYNSGGIALQELLSRDTKPTAVLCINDMMAMGCLDEARLIMGLSVPEDLSIASFDGTGMAQFASYELTTVRQPIGRMSQAAVDLITARIERPGQSNEKHVFEGALIEGRSIAEVPG